MSLRFLFLLLAIGLLAAAPAVVADPGIEWVTVGDPGNPPDAATGRGAVAGPFQISKHEVTIGQYAEFLNAVAKNDPHGLWHGGLPIARTGDPGAFAYAAAAGREREPVVRVTFLDCMRFANWLHHLQGAAPADPAQLTETGAYDIAAGGGLAARAPGARAWIPNQDEWYKAAYHQPHAAGGPAGHYWRYPTKSDAQPTAGKAGDASPNVANFMLGEADARALMPVGSFPNAAGHYGTFDQGGNAWEWVEAIVFDTQRMLRGGSGAGSHEKLLAVTRSSASPTRRYPDVGFRVARAMPPEPPPAAATQPDHPNRARLWQVVNAPGP